MNKSKREEAGSLEAKMDVIIYLLLKLIGNEDKPDFKANKEIIKRLSRLGMATKDLANLFNTSESSVSQMKVRK